MAKYRQLYTEFWSDSFVLELPHEEKFFYLYLLTNTKTTQSGIYEISKKFIELETGLSNEVIEKLLNKFKEYNKILYSTDTKEIMILNWMKYNVPNNINAKICVNRELLRVKYKEFLEILYDKCIVTKLDVDKIFEGIIIDENDKNDDVDSLIKVDELPVDVILNSDNEECDIKSENEKSQENNNSGKEEVLELSRNYLLYAPFTGDLQGPYQVLGSNRIRSKKEKVINKKQELINKEEVVTSKKGVLSKSAAISNCDGIKGVIKVFEENVHAITPLIYEKILEFTKHVSNKVILMAIDEAVNFDVKNMQYISKILNSWISNGINTAQQVLEYQKQWSSKKKSTATQTVKPGGFCDYEQRTYDFDLLEKGLLGQL
ncbi:DnaD domain-containing protein [Clostridium lacusfryxellense]|uniref:DnaD domain-containing protein n=1 Tax=Clostridium lacusfryxellense TaxID=205328 RepID=UPI001C0ABC7F|nr:DnaD domain protein [Clostridium lacusfryxellense]MBU3113572.1 DnaD domain protein [Clostridium lacusfryxellense]